MMVGKLLALDVGLARIGVATCDPLQLTVRPLTVMQRGARRADFERLAQLVRAEASTAVICGLPLYMDGSEGENARRVREWALRLAQALRAILGDPLPVIFWDERLSTFAAQEYLRTTGQTTGEDALAAAVILQSYLDAQRQGEPQDFGRIVLPKRTAQQRSEKSL
jgi:putative holliday junction resolvase